MEANATINVSVSNLYREPTFSSEIVSQGILGEPVEILDRGDVFAKILQKDNYTSWISSDQIVDLITPSEKTVLVKDHFIRMYQEPTTESHCVRDAVIGTRLAIFDENDSWYQLQLPDDTAGWALKKHFGDFPDFTPKNILFLAKQFLGYQYFWGGITPKGFDCSGFVQTVFDLHGVQLNRDAWQQQEKNVISTNFHDAEPGDLLFFAKTPKRVTHVAIALGDGRFIHASGLVKLNSLMINDQDFSKVHLDTFVSVNRYFN